MNRMIICVSLCVVITASISYALDFKAFNIDGLAKGSPDTKAVEKLGQPEKKTKPELWGATGDWHSTYEWPSKGISMDIVGDSENAKAWSIGDITVKSPFTGKTDKGIGIGTDATEITKAYGKATNKKADEISYSEGECCTIVTFTLKNGKVEKIWIGPTPE